MEQNMQAVKERTIFELLEKNNLTASDKNYQIAETMLRANMSVDRSSMQLVLKQAYQYPDTPIQTLVSMNKMGLPVNEHTISGYEQYQTNQHAMMQALSDFTQELVEFAKQPNSSVESALPYQDILSVFSDAEDMPVLNMETLMQDVQDMQNIQEIQEIQEMPDKQSLPADFLPDNLLPESADKFGVSEQTINKLVQNLQSFNIDMSVIETLLTKSNQPMQLMNHLQELVSNMVSNKMLPEKSAREFFLSDDMQELFEHAVKSKFSIHPSEMQDPQEVTELYKSMYAKMEQAVKQFDNQTGSFGQHLSESAKGMQERIDFLQNLNQLFPYAQIPVRFEGHEKNADLFVYMNKKRMQEKKEDVSALLHLDMDYLGPTDVHVSLRGSIVHTKFYVEDEESAKLLDAHMTQLSQAIEESGYSLTNEVITREPSIHPDTEKNAVIREMFSDDLEKSVKRYSFDVRM